MSVNVAEGTVEIKNQLGLHVRSSALLAKTAIKFLSHITIAYGDNRVSARSAVALTMLGARVGTRLTVTAEGPDAADALRAVQTLFEEGFGEE